MFLFEFITFIAVSKQAISTFYHHIKHFNQKPTKYFYPDVNKYFQALDYEQQREYGVRIVAYDGGSPSLSSTLSLNIIVQDTNDNEPKFEKSLYQVDVDESLPKDSQILSLKAVDADQGKNGRLEYRITDSDTVTDQLLGILPSSGIIFLKKQLDREQVESLAFSVIVRDQGVPSLSSSTRVKINIADSNDNKPMFRQSEYRVEVSENVPLDSSLVQVEASDGDQGRNGQISFSIKTQNRRFRIEPSTGKIIITDFS